MPKKPAKPPTFTIREVEELSPCYDEYTAALLLLKSRPVPGGGYDISTKRRRGARYGPDDPILLAEVAPLLKRSHLSWLLFNVLPDISDVVTAHLAETDELRYHIAIAELYGPGSTKKSPLKGKRK